MRAIINPLLVPQPGRSDHRQQPTSISQSRWSPSKILRRRVLTPFLAHPRSSPAPSHTHRPSAATARRSAGFNTFASAIPTLASPSLPRCTPRLPAPLGSPAGAGRREAPVSVPISYGSSDSRSLDCPCLQRAKTRRICAPSTSSMVRPWAATLNEEQGSQVLDAVTVSDPNTSPSLGPPPPPWKISCFGVEEIGAMPELAAVLPLRWRRRRPEPTAPPRRRALPPPTVVAPALLNCCEPAAGRGYPWSSSRHRMKAASRRLIRAY